MSLPSHRSTARSPQELGRCARSAVKKHVKKIIRHEADVLADQDIEALHQMRIGLRRLRSTIQTFNGILDLPPQLQDTTLKPLAKTLGKVRDLDVLLVTLRDRLRPTLPKTERKALDRVIGKLEKKRDRHFRSMVQYLHSSAYQTLQTTAQSWVNATPTPPIETIPIQQVLADVLLSVQSHTFLHPAWFTAPAATARLADFHPLPPQQTRSMDQHQAVHTLNHWLDHQGPVLHDLRKRVKQLRYQAAFFTHHYGTAYDEYIQDLKAIQDSLGVLQDYWVLEQVLIKVTGKSWQTTFPVLAAHIRDERWIAWQQWEPLRQYYVKVETRSHLHQLILHPNAET